MSDLKLMEDKILASLEASQKKILTSIQAVTDRFDVLENQVAVVSSRQSELDSKLRKLAEQVDGSTAQITIDVEKRMRDLKEDVQEERRKLIRLCNVVLFGVPETKDGLDLATHLLGVILPDWKGVVDDDRIGNVDAPQPRPLRIKLDNHHQKRKALSSKRKLAKFPEFMGISYLIPHTSVFGVHPSGSMTQPTPRQNGSSKQGTQTRSDRKRRCSSELDESQISKFGKGDDSTHID
jgi:hypothetical protein